MRAWRVVLLLNLALAVGLGWGWVWWGRPAERLQRELMAARALAAASAVERDYQAQGIVRAVLPEINVLVITHDEIPGYMPAMTMGFRAASAGIHDAVQVGDTVRFTLRGIPPNVVVTTIQKIAP